MVFMQEEFAWTAKAAIAEITFGLTADVTEAHRWVSLHPSESYLQCRQLHPSGEACIDTVAIVGFFLWEHCYWVYQ